MQKEKVKKVGLLTFAFLLFNFFLFRCPVVNPRQAYNTEQRKPSIDGNARQLQESRSANGGADLSSIRRLPGLVAASAQSSLD
jgi:hypothetical protein